MHTKLVGITVVALCLLAAIPWSYVVTGTDLAFVLFALAPPLLLASGLGIKAAREGAFEAAN